MATHKASPAVETTAKAEVEGIDLEAWLTGAPAVTDSVRVTNRLDLVLRIEELDAQIKADSETVQVERSAADPGPGDPDEDYKILVAQYLDSFKTFTFRQRYTGDWEKIRAAMRFDKANLQDVNEANLYATAEFSVEPRMTVEQVRALATTIGGPQFDRIVDCWSRLANGVIEVKAPK